MNPLRSLFSLLLSALWLGALPSLADSPTHPAPASLCVMTYNVRLQNPGEKPADAWPKRRPLMRELLQKVSPDLFGTQEGLYGQIKDLAADLPDYEWIGTGRDGGSRGEFMAVFFRRTRFEPLAYDHFWLSDTPEVIGSSTWGNRNRRMVTWVKFRDRSTGQEFFLFNTHFDHQVQPAREKSATLIRQRVAALETKLPVIVTGDFNAHAETNPAYKILTENSFFTDAWLAARERRNEGVGTVNGFKAINPNGARIDWILTRGEVTVDIVKTVTFSRAGRFPSDHFPVVAWLRLGPAR